MENLKYFEIPSLKYFMKFLIFIIKWIKTFKNTIKVYEVSGKYIMLFVHNNRYLPLITGLLTFMKYFTPKKKSWTFAPLTCIDAERVWTSASFWSVAITVCITVACWSKSVVTISTVTLVVILHSTQRGRWNCRTGQWRTGLAGVDIAGLNISGRVCESELGNMLSFWSSVFAQK